MTDEKSAYRQVMKATSVFGGVQVFNILISIVRTKVIAVLLGSFGMGIAGLLNSAIQLISAVTNLGMDRSAVKDISSAFEEADEEKIARTIGIVKKIVWITGIVGALITIILSPLLSELAFDSKDFTFSFIWVSVALLFKQLASGNLVVLQGLRKIEYLAKANLTGSFVGLLISVPLYYYFRIDAIVPAIIISFFMSFVFSRYYTNKIKTKKISITAKEAFFEGKEMVRLGIMLSISSLLTVLATYALHIYISNVGGVSEVGFYAAGVVILNSYVGIIFNAMATDYYPRLAAIHRDNVKVREVVSQQAFVAVLIITPIIILFLMFSSLVIKILYSTEFLVIVSMVTWGILGTLFKAMSFSMGYIIIAKGDSKVFIKTAVGFNTLLFLMNILGYSYGGLTGLGISFFVYYIIHFIVVGILTKSLYNFYFTKSFYLLFVFCSVFCALAFLTTYFLSETNWRYLILAIIFVISVVVSVYQLHKKMNLRELFDKLKYRNKK